MVTFGVDTHKATLAASAIDPTGRELGARTFPNDRAGHVRLQRWAEGHGTERRFGIEGSGSYGAALGRLLVTAGEEVVEVPAVLTDRERRHLRRVGKSDPGDALAIARVALREPTLGPIPLPGITEDLKLLVDARDQRILERTRVVNRRHGHLVVLAPGYKRELPSGNRQLNRALHTIAVVQARCDPRAKAYMAKRMAEGKSRLEALRCLKRHLANVVLRTMLADAKRRAVLGAEGLTT